MGDAELQLIVEACRSTFPNRVPLSDFSWPEIRWDRVLALSRRHRVQGLLYEGLEHLLGKIPREIADRLRADAEEVIRANLQIAAESARLLSRFRAADVDLLFLKGLALGALLYRKPYLKMGWDIDLFVPQEQLDLACALLRSAGYAPAIPEGANDRQLAKWHETRKESVWCTAGGTIYIDLHTRLADNPSMLRDVATTSVRQVATLGENIQLPTLGNDELFAYLAVHGASSAWFRLKWAVDLAALVSTRKGNEVERLFDRSQLMGAGRAAAQALLIVDDLFGIGLDHQFRSKLAADPLNRWLATAALREINRMPEPTERPLGTLMIHLTQLALMPGPRFAISEAHRQFREATSRALADDQVAGRA